jgi:hypothetical protein
MRYFVVLSFFPSSCHDGILNWFTTEYFHILETLFFINQLIAWHFAVRAIDGAIK